MNELGSIISQHPWQFALLFLGPVVYGYTCMNNSTWWFILLFMILPFILANSLVFIGLHQLIGHIGNAAIVYHWQRYSWLLVLSCAFFLDWCGMFAFIMIVANSGVGQADEKDVLLMTLLFALVGGLIGLVVAVIISLGVELVIRLMT